MHRLLSRVSEDEKVCWLVQRFGWKTISTIGSVLKSLPKALTEAQQSSFLLSQCINHQVHMDVDTLNSVAQFLQEDCSNFVSSFPEEKIVLSPSLSECPSCDSRLVSYHQCSVRIYSVSGVKSVPKVTLRCQGCRLLFVYSQFGNKESLGFRYYSESRPNVEVSDVIFVEQSLLELQCSLA